MRSDKVARTLGGCRGAKWSGPCSDDVDGMVGIFLFAAALLVACGMLGIRRSRHRRGELVNGSRHLSGC